MVTYMTGELFASLGKGGTLAALMNAQDTVESADAFAQGLELARRREPLSHSLFSIRARVVTGALPPACARSFVSGVLIGTEFAAAPGEVDSRSLTLVGSSALAERYRVAAAYFDWTATALDPDAVYCAALGQLLHKDAR
jgi:2-dehydro-3-deoxygalactonokinase